MNFFIKNAETLLIYGNLLPDKSRVFIGLSKKVYWYKIAFSPVLSNIHRFGGIMLVDHSGEKPPDFLRMILSLKRKWPEKIIIESRIFALLMGKNRHFLFFLLPYLFSAANQRRSHRQRLVFEPQVVRYHRDKFRIGGLASGVLYGVAEEGVQHVEITSVPRDLYRMAYRTFDA